MEAVPLSEDLIEGGVAISAELGVPTRRGYRLLEKKLIPAFKLAGKWYARRSTLRARIVDLERGDWEEPRSDLTSTSSQSQG